MTDYVAQIGRIRNAQNLDELREIARKHSADALKQGGVLYTGPVGVDLRSETVAKVMAEASDISIINDTPRGQFLGNRQVERAVDNSVRRIFISQGQAPEIAERSAKDFIYGNKELPLEHPLSVRNSLWGEASREFANSLSGDVKVVANAADVNRVLGQVEIPAVLDNPRVTSLAGQPIAKLKAVYAQGGSEAVLPKVQAPFIEAAQRGLFIAPERTGAKVSQVSLSREFAEAMALNPGRLSTFPPAAELAASGFSRVPVGTEALAAESAAVRQNLRPNAAMKGLGVAAAAATAYDIADTAHDVSRLRAQGNAAAAEDRITRFAAQNLGGWGGAAAGFGVGAAAGVQSGPGLLATGAVGGIVGAVAGDQVADWIRERKINRQDDRQGNTWTFDPDHPARGWTRSVREIDVEAMRYSTRDALIYQTRTLTANAALSDVLTWKASSQSIELALGAPPQGRDPYRIAVEAGEMARHSPLETGRVWTCDPQTRQWRQEITEVLDGRIPITRREPASAEQAEALEQQSQAIIAQNARQTPAAMAVQFQRAYEQNGWAQAGPLPKAVTDALRHPGRVVGSDGDLYTRNAQGQWTHDGTLWDSQAQGNLRRELEATYQRQQADAQIPTLDTVRVTPPAPERGAATAPSASEAPARDTLRDRSALPDGFAPPMRPSLDLRDPDHPGHPAFARTLAEVHRAETTRGIPHGPHSERVAAALLLEAARNRQGITNVEIGPEGRIVGLERYSMMEPAKQVSIDSNQALSMSMDQYAAGWAQIRSPHYASQASEAERTPEQARALAQLSPQDRAMFARIRGGVPSHIADDVVAHAMVLAKEDGINGADRISAVVLIGDKLWVAGTTPGFRVAVDVSAATPDLPDMVQRNQDFNQERQLAVEAAQREQQQTQGRGLSV